MFKPRPFNDSLSPKPERKITIREIFPHLSPEQQAEAEFFLKRYLEIVRRIFERTNT